MPRRNMKEIHTAKSSKYVENVKYVKRTLKEWLKKYQSADETTYKLILNSSPNNYCN